MFQKIVRQYLILTEKNTNFLQTQEVQQEILDLKNKLSSFKVFGKKFARQKFLPSFIGGKQKENVKMGKLRNSFDMNLNGTGTAYENLSKRLTTRKRSKSQSNARKREKILIGTDKNNSFINGTSIKMTKRNLMAKKLREQFTDSLPGGVFK